MIVNGGSSAATLGRLQLTAQDGGVLSAMDDACSMVRLEPGASCRVRVVLEPQGSLLRGAAAIEYDVAAGRAQLRGVWLPGRRDP